MKDDRICENYQKYYKYKKRIASFIAPTPKVRQKKSNFWGVFIMKLTYEDKGSNI